MKRSAKLGTIAATIRSAMAAKGLRQVDILDAFNGHSGQASKVVNGCIPVSKSVALRLSAKLDIPLEVLLGAEAKQETLLGGDAND